jgi:tungstate transport system permease protein
MDTLLSFPTVVIGLLVYGFLSRQGPLGELGLLFTLPGIAIGQTILGLPIVIALTASAVESLDRRLRPTLLTLGANERQILLTTICEARFSLMAAAVTAYGRIVSEVGISMMVGGNIKWYTRTITTAIALETNKGKFGMGIALGLVLLLIAFTVNLVLAVLRRRMEG